MSPATSGDQLKGRNRLGEPFARMQEHLAANNVDLAKTPAAYGAPLSFDPADGKVHGRKQRPLPTSTHGREYRAPWIVPRYRKPD
jgi:hypothetical protein